MKNFKSSVYVKNNGLSMKVYGTGIVDAANGIKLLYIFIQKCLWNRLMLRVNANCFLIHGEKIY